MDAFIAAPQRRAAGWQQKPLGAAEDVLEKRAKLTRASFEWSVGNPTYREDFCRAGVGDRVSCAAAPVAALKPM
jgi:hypothetical protein